MTPLFERMTAHDYGNPQTTDLMRKIWAGTPWMVDCATGPIDGEHWREIMGWCRQKWGIEAFPIHGRSGRWQSGNATVFGWTWFGFETEEMMREFCARWRCGEAAA